MLGGAAFIYVPAFALAVRRLHDQNITGWAFVISFFPVLGELIIFIAMCWPGTEGDNKYGPSRLSVRNDEGESEGELEKLQTKGPWIEEDDSTE